MLQDHSPNHTPLHRADVILQSQSVHRAMSHVRVILIGLSAVTMLISASAAQDAAPAAQDAAADTERSEVLEKFLVRFDQIEAQGWVTTRRAGDTGVGYTLESLLGVPENNLPLGDFHGMEVKAYRDAEAEFDDNEKMNLFLKEPAWVDGLNSADRVRQYGYRDENNRQAWYLSVTSSVNEAGLKLSVDSDRTQLQLSRHDILIGSWTVDVLQRRLSEKHGHSVFVAAESRGDGPDEEFHYTTVTWCRDPDAGRLLDLVESGDVVVELRMHLRENGTLRNHGTAFRVRKQKLQTLFALQQTVRPVK